MYFVITFILCILISFPAGNSEYTYCNKTAAYNVTSPNGKLFLRNIEDLYSVLSSNASQPSGFYNYTSGGGSSGPPVYGLFLCRGDATATICQSCLVSAAAAILQTCPNVTRAVTWFDDCMLRHSDVNIFSMIQLGGYRVWEERNYTDGALLNRTLSAVFDRITMEAAYGDHISGKKFAVAEANLTEFTKLFAMGQCTPDLSDLDCEYCLRAVIIVLPDCCNNSPSARILRPSCNIRYSTTPFFQSLPPPPQPAPVLPLTPPSLQPMPSPPSLPGGGGTSTAKISAIISPITTALVASVVAFFIYNLND